MRKKWLYSRNNSFFAILNNFLLYDGGQVLLMDERAQIHYTMHLRRDHRPSASKLTNFLTQSHRSEQDSNRRGLEMRGLVVWDRCLNHSNTEVPRTRRTMIHSHTCISWKICTQFSVNSEGWLLLARCYWSLEDNMSSVHCITAETWGKSLMKMMNILL
jgi:hypothetical protein